MPMRRYQALRLPVLAALVLGMAALACNVQLGGTPPLPGGEATSGIILIAPENNSVIGEGVHVEIAAAARDTLTGVSKITFSLDGAPLESLTAPIPEGQTTFTAKIVWVTKGIQGHLLTAEAFRADGSSLGEAGVTVQVVPLNTGDPTLSAAVSTMGSVDILKGLSTLAPTETPSLPPTHTPTPTATVTPTPAAEGETPTASPTFIAPTLRVTFDFLNIRRGPGTTYDPIGRMNKGDTAKVVGRNADRTWVVIEWGSVRGWVSTSANLVEISGDTTNLPLVAVQDAPGATPTLSIVQPGLAPTSAPGDFADLIIEAYTITPQTPLANQTFYITVVVRNQGTVDAPASLLTGIFQPGNERSDMSVPPIAAGGLVTLPPLYITLKTGGPNQEGVLSLDVQNEVDEGQIGEQNNRRTITYNVIN